MVLQFLFKTVSYQHPGFFLEVNSRSEGHSWKRHDRQKKKIAIGVFKTKESSVERKDLLGWNKFEVCLR